MCDFNDIKNELISDMWLPIIKRAGDVLYPRLRKNKKMSVLTLTTDINFEEVNILVSEKLTEKEKIIAWNNNHIKKTRLETELGPSLVFGATRYEDAISGQAFPLNNYFPFDIIILDFYSQNPLFEVGRIEKEIISVEKSIKLQGELSGFVLIYTTILNSNTLNLLYVQNSSDNIRIPGWEGLRIDTYPQEVQDIDQKMNCIIDMLSQISQKYHYNGDYEEKQISLSDGKTILSIATLLKR